MEKYIELLEEWVSDDRRLRNNSLESDFDRFCEEKNVAIEALINKVKELEENRIWSEETISGLKEDFIPKSKIREKKEEYKNQSLTVCCGRSQGKTFKQAVQSEVIKILQDLLEEK